MMMGAIDGLVRGTTTKWSDFFLVRGRVRGKFTPLADQISPYRGRYIGILYKD